MLAARIIYMCLFTLTVFFLAFKTLNQQHFTTLSQYKAFGQHRDSQILNMTYEVENWYEGNFVPLFRSSNVCAICRSSNVCAICRSSNVCATCQLIKLNSAIF